jgi:peptide/nickel transport system substrate-binding protein
MVDTMQLRVFLAGRVAIETGAIVLDEGRLAGRQGRLVFAYLVSEQGRPVPRDQLAEALWGPTPPATWDKALTVIASKLRRALTDAGVDGATALTSAFGCYRLDLPEGAWVDLTAAADAAEAAEQALAAGDLEAARADASLAASLLRQPFLPGDDGAWVEQKRREIADLHVRALRVLGDTSLRLDDAADAAKWAEQAIALEPFRESGYRRLMEAHAAAGNRAEALQVYERCRRLLSEELGAYPSPETESIYRRLLAAPTPGDGAAQTAVTKTEEEPAGAPPTPESRRWAIVAASAAVAVAAVSAVIVFSGSTSHSPPSTVASSLTGNSVGVLDLTNDKKLADVSVANRPSAVATGLGAVWVANLDDDSVSKLDEKTNSLVQTIPVGDGPSGVTTGGGFVWVANSLGDSVWQIDPTTYAAVKKFPLGGSPSGIAYGGGAVWVADATDKTIRRIDPLKETIGKPIQVDAGAAAIAFGDGSVWVASQSTGSISRIDPASGNDQPINVGNGPSAIAFGDGSIWVANTTDGTVSQIDPGTNRQEAVISVGAGPTAVSVTPDGKTVWVANSAAGTLSRIDTSQARTVQTVTTGNHPDGIGLGGKAMYVAVRTAGDTHIGGTLRVAVEGSLQSATRPDVLDPSITYYALTWQVLMITNDGLVGFQRVGGIGGQRLEPDLAVRIPTATDHGLVYTFQLQPGIRYSNGQLVRPADIERAIQRSLTNQNPDGTGPGPSYYSDIVGAAACVTAPRTCDLAEGIRTGANTISFHLTRPDPAFLYKLAMPTAYAEPADTPLAPRLPLPATGPYEIASYTRSPKQERETIKLVRNPRFHVWSAAAQPAGYPDAIEIDLANRPPGTEARGVERGTWDLTGIGGDVPAALRAELRTRYSGQLHDHPNLGTLAFEFNTRIPPFNSLKARQAFNYAIDRNRLAILNGGRDFNQPTCQYLPPGVLGYKPYCPYPGPDLAKARALVAASGTKGDKVVLNFGFPYLEHSPFPKYMKSVLEELGYDVRIHGVPPHVYAVRFDSAHRWQSVSEGWNADYPDPSAFFTPLSCAEFVPRSTSSENFSEFCDPGLDAAAAHAGMVAQSNPQAAAALWARIDRNYVDQAPWAPFIAGRVLELTSARTGNYVFSQWVGSAILDQLWVR